MPKRHHIEDLYLKAFGERDRSFIAYDDHVLAVDDSGGFDVTKGDKAVMVLIAELLKSGAGYDCSKAQNTKLIAKSPTHFQTEFATAKMLRQILPNQ